MARRYDHNYPKRLPHTKANRYIACFNAKTGDVEDAPALDALPVFKTIERDGAVYISGEESAIKSSKRKPNFKCTTAVDESRNRVVVVGGGSGALGVVEGLREEGFKGAITVISNEGYLPIDRPKLSKALLTDTSKLAWRDKAWFEQGAVDWLDGEVVDVNHEKRTVTTKKGDKVEYTRLVLATGGTPKLLPLQGFKVLGNIFTLRNAHDTQKIVDAIGEKNKKIVIVGSSFIGMEAAVATCQDNDVTVIGMEKVPLQQVLGEQVGAGLQKLVEGKGVKFQLGASVDKAEPSTSDPSKVGSVSLKDGTKLEADLVILGIGVSPATDFLRKSSNFKVDLEEDGSLKTRTNFSVEGIDHVYAIGDIASFPYQGPGGEGKLTRIEHWNVAQNAGRGVARHIAKNEDGEQFIPVFWSALGAQMRYCGNISNGWDDVVIDGNPAEASFVAYYTKGETVVAMASMGRDPAMVQTAALMRTRTMPSKSQLNEKNDILAHGIPA